MQLIEKDTPCAREGCTNVIKPGSYAHLNVDAENNPFCSPDCIEILAGTKEAPAADNSARKPGPVAVKRDAPAAGKGKGGTPNPQ
jgi:hypothetical protein